MCYENKQGTCFRLELGDYLLIQDFIEQWKAPKAIQFKISS